MPEEHMRHIFGHVHRRRLCVFVAKLYRHKYKRIRQSSLHVRDFPEKDTSAKATADWQRRGKGAVGVRSYYSMYF